MHKIWTTQYMFMVFSVNRYAELRSAITSYQGKSYMLYIIHIVYLTFIVDKWNL